MTVILVIISMVVFGFIVDSEECKEKGKISAIKKLASWWICKMKSNKTGWMIKICVLAVIYFLIGTLIG